jgi:hypothetical protein
MKIIPIGALSPRAVVRGGLCGKARTPGRRLSPNLNPVQGIGYTCQRAGRRALCFGLALAACLAVGLLWAGGAAAAPEEKCIPAPKTASSYCVALEAGISSTRAGTPFATNLSMANTSPGFNSSQSVWSNQVTIRLVGSPTRAGKVFTPSRLLPDGLRIANSPSCTRPRFADCTAGGGGFRALVSGTGVLFDGYRNGTFGIRRIENVRDTGTTDDVHLRVVLALCVEGFGQPCFISTDYELEFRAAQTSTTELKIPLRLEGDLAAGGMNAHFKAGIRSLRLHLDATSNTLRDGSKAARSYPLATIPEICGPLEILSDFTAASGRTLGFKKRLDLWGCKTKTRVKASRARGKIKALGQVKPGPGGKVGLTLLRRAGNRFQKVAKTKATLRPDGSFTATLPSRRSGKCKVEARYAGKKPYWGASSDTAGVRC